MRRRTRRAAAAALVLMTAAALAGCDGGPRPGPSATALPPGISATLLPSAAPDEALVRIGNDSDESLEIGWLRVDAPGFAHPSWVRSNADRIVPGRTVALVSIPLPDARCRGTVRGATRLTVQYALGASIAVASAPIADPGSVVTTLTETECADGGGVSG